METEWKQWSQSRTPEDYSKLFEAVKPTIDTALKSYAGGTSSETVRQRANIMAYDAIQSFDPNKGANLKSHLMTQLRPLTRYGRKVTQSVDIPDKRVSDMYKLTSAEQELADSLGRDPTDEELADFTGLSRKRLKVIRQSRLAEYRPIFDEEGAELDASTTSINPEDVWIDYVHHDLDPVSKKIMEWKLGLYGNRQLSNQEIAKRLRLTPSAVSQRTNTIIKKLREFNALPSDEVY